MQNKQVKVTAFIRQGGPSGILKKDFYIMDSEEEAKKLIQDLVLINDRQGNEYYIKQDQYTVKVSKKYVPAPGQIVD